MAELALERPVQRPSRWIAALRRGGPKLWIGSTLGAVLVLVALPAPLIAPHNPIEQDLMSAQLPPAWTHVDEPSLLFCTVRHCQCAFSGPCYSLRYRLSL